MTDKYYDVYFDPSELEVDRDGHLENPEALHIIEIEYANETERIICGQRVDEKGNAISEPMEWDEVFRLNHEGFGDDPTIEKALDRFYKWLAENLDWRETTAATRYDPPEYTCFGIIGHVDDEPRYHHWNHSWY